MVNVYIYFRLAWNISIRFHMSSPLFNILRKKYEMLEYCLQYLKINYPFYWYCTWISSKQMTFVLLNEIIHWDVTNSTPFKQRFTGSSLFIIFHKQLEFQWIFIFDPWTLLKPDFISDVVVTCNVLLNVFLF